MPGPYVLDTNLFIDASRDEREEEALARFQSACAPFTLLSAVVAHELRAGIRSARDRQAVQDALLAPLERRERIVVPSYRAWQSAAETLAALSRREGRPVGEYGRAFVNDVLIAVSCQQAGATVITRNLADFERIRRVLRFRFVPPWPLLRPVAVTRSDKS